MPRYSDQEVSFDVPRDWEDKTVVAFVMPPKPGQPLSANLVMTRDVLNPNEDIRSYSDRQLVEMAKRISSFALRKRHEFEVNNLPVAEIQFGWRGESGPLEQRVAFISIGQGKIVTLTATMPKGDMPKLNPIFDRIFASFKRSSDVSGAPLAPT